MQPEPFPVSLTRDLLAGSDFLDMPPAPVLSNKYAIEREERATLPRRSNSNKTTSSQNQLSVDMRSRRGYSPRYRGMETLPHPHQPSPCRPRIMSPMGFAISRQQTQRQAKSARLSRYAVFLIQL